MLRRSPTLTALASRVPAEKLTVAVTLLPSLAMRPPMLSEVSSRSALWPDRSATIVGAAMFGFIAWLGWYETLKSYDIGAFEGEHPVRIPVWPLWGILVFGAVLTTLQFLNDIYRYVTDGPARDEVSEVVEVEID